MYSLNGVSLGGLGFIAGKQDNSNLALSGFLDFPSRVGKTGHEWANEKGIEPYVEASEIFFGGRSLKLTGYITGIDRDHCENKRLRLIDLFDSFTTLVPLVSKWGTNNVLIDGPVISEFRSNQLLKIDIPFREPSPILNGAMPVASGAEFGIDGISFAALGGYQVGLSGDRRNRTAPKEAKFTAYGKEGFAITQTVAEELTLKLYIKQANYTLFRSRMAGLYALFKAPGIRNLTANNDKLRSFYVKDGFTVTNLRSRPTSFTGMVEVRLTQTGMNGTMTELVDSLGSMITDDNNNQIMVRT